ncbi:hypothetical protein chiPu_0032013, partial [Chiloscyllium punctatum]|nr:hypothetical protein [Chiloscyllium punctatum]
PGSASSRSGGLSSATAAPRRGLEDSVHARQRLAAVWRTQYTHAAPPRGLEDSVHARQRLTAVWRTQYTHGSASPRSGGLSTRTAAPPRGLEDSVLAFPQRSGGDVRQTRSGLSRGGCHRNELR